MAEQFLYDNKNTTYLVDNKTGDRKQISGAEAAAWLVRNCDHKGGLLILNGVTACLSCGATDMG